MPLVISILPNSILKTILSNLSIKHKLVDITRTWRTSQRVTPGPRLNYFRFMSLLTSTSARWSATQTTTVSLVMQYDKCGKGRPKGCSEGAHEQGPLKSRPKNFTRLYISMDFFGLKCSNRLARKETIHRQTHVLKREVWIIFLLGKRDDVLVPSSLLWRNLNWCSTN